MSLTNTQAAYIAGILDGEGCFSVRDGGGQYRRYSSSVSVVSTTPDLLRWLLDKVPGSLLSTGTTDAERGREQQHNWRISSKEILLWFLPQVIPYLIIKKLHAQLLLKYCLEFEEQIAGIKLTDEETALKEAYCVLFSNLNSTGVGSLRVKENVMKLFKLGDIQLPGEAI